MALCNLFRGFSVKCHFGILNYRNRRKWTPFLRYFRNLHISYAFLEIPVWGLRIYLVCFTCFTPVWNQRRAVTRTSTFLVVGRVADLYNLWNIVIDNYFAFLSSSFLIQRFEQVYSLKLHAWLTTTWVRTIGRAKVRWSNDSNEPENRSCYNPRTTWRFLAFFERKSREHSLFQNGRVRVFELPQLEILKKKT